MLLVAQETSCKHLAFQRSRQRIRHIKYTNIVTKITLKYTIFRSTQALAENMACLVNQTFKQIVLYTEI